MILKRQNHRIDIALEDAIITILESLLRVVDYTYHLIRLLRPLACCVRLLRPRDTPNHHPEPCLNQIQVPSDGVSLDVVTENPIMRTAFSGLAPHESNH